MDARQLQAFVAVVDIGSFTRAAVKLQLSQPTVTSRVKALEQALGTVLVERLPAGIKPTASGSRLLPYARDIVALIARARHSVTTNGQPHGRIDVGTIESLTAYRLLPMIEFLYLRYPKVEISMHEPARGEALSRVREGRLDCAFVMDSPVTHPDLETKTLCPEPLLLVGGPDHPLTDASVATDSDLDRATVIRADTSADYHAKFEDILRSPRIFELGSVDAVKRSVANGLGMTLLPAVAVAEELANGQLRRVNWTPPFETYTQIAWRHDRLDPVRDALVSAAVQVVEEQRGRIVPA